MSSSRTPRRTSRRLSIPAASLPDGPSIRALRPSRTAGSPGDDRATQIQVAIGDAVVSTVLVVALWDGLRRSGAFGAVAFDVAILVSLLVVRRPSPELLGN